MKSYRPWNPDQHYLLPPAPRDWLPEGHLALFLLDVVEELDLSAIEDAIQAKDPRGNRPYSPRMLMALLLYGYSVGVFSSRKIERATYEDVAFRVLAGEQHPDHWTLANFRKQHLETFRDVFVQVVQLCQRLGLVKLGTLALDGSKVQANASKHKAMSYGRMKKEVLRLQTEIDGLLEKATAVDGSEDARFGEGQRDEDLPAEIRRRESRGDRIREAMTALESEARAARAAVLHEQSQQQRKQAASQTDPAEARRAHTRAEQRERLAESFDEGGEEDDQDDDDLPKHRPRHHIDGTPTDKAQRNFTDPDSRIMKRNGGFLQGYNGQAVVDEESQVIVAAALGNQPPDSQYLEPLLAQVRANTGRVPDHLLADSGYAAEANLQWCEDEGIEALIALPRRPGSRAPPDQGKTPATQRMRQRLATDEGMTRYAKRKHIVEPVFGQIKEARGFRRFLLRGIDNVRREWDLVCATHNILKMWRSGKPLAMA